jgi:hypothetical protein
MGHACVGGLLVLRHAAQMGFVSAVRPLSDRELTKYHVDRQSCIVGERREPDRENKRRKINVI